MAGPPEPAAKRPRTEGVAVPTGLAAFRHVEDWFEEHKASFAPPVCNKLMHKGQLSIMFVGGPNTRKDFHLEQGSEFFYQMRGDIELPTIQRGKRKLVKIRQGQVFCLPSRVPHSPQRPMPGSFGLVIERERVPGEMDGLIYFTDFEQCEKVHWEKFFRCEDLGKDLPPVIGAYKQFEASEQGKKAEAWPVPEEERPVRQDRETEVPPPFHLADFLLAHEANLARGKVLPLFGADHPDKEFKVLVAGGPGKQSGQHWSGETWLYQLRGSATVEVAGGSLALEEGCCCIVKPNVPYSVVRAKGSAGLVVRQDPAGNKRAAAADTEEAEAAAGEEAEDTRDDEEGAEEEEEEEEAGDASPREEGGACGGAARAAPQHLATVEAINTLAGMVVDELAILRMQWRELITSTKAAAAGEQMQHDAEERADRSERGAVSRQKQASQAEQWFRLDDGQQQLLTCRMSAAAPEQAPRAAAALPTTVPGDGTVAPLPPRLSAPAATLRGPVTGPPWHGAVPQGGAPPGGPPPGAAPRVQAPQMGTLQGARPPAPWHASRPGAVAAAAPGQSRLYQSPAWARVPTWSPNAC
mmetsp:Transcript_76845/g.232940  ORF Transcript_76845/g.232940 Transcript_76845/m.232940 type:complete len:581 (-) Transcript_76845:474-2216(-)